MRPRLNPIALIAEVPIILIARKDLPPNIQGFRDYAKATRQNAIWARPELAPHDLACVLMGLRDRGEYYPVPIAARARRCRSPGGRIDYICEVITTGNLRSTRHVKGLAIFQDKRSPAIQLCPRCSRKEPRNLPPILERNPCAKNTPADIVRKLNDAPSQAIKRHRCANAWEPSAPKSCRKTAPRRNSGQIRQGRIAKWRRHQASGESIDWFRRVPSATDLCLRPL